MKTNGLVILIILLFTSGAYSETLSNKADVKGFLDNVMQTIVSCDVDGAFNLMKSNTQISVAEMDAVAKQSKAQRVKLFGEGYKSAGSQYLGTQTGNPYILKIMYIEQI